MNLLIVDDNLQNCRRLVTILKKGGSHVLTAGHGKEALELLQDEHVDCIISALFMPVMDGFQLCRTVKSTENLKEIPFIFFATASSDEKEERFALRLGADSFFRGLKDSEIILAQIQKVQQSPKPKNFKEMEEEVYLREYSEILKKTLDNTRHTERVGQKLSQFKKRYQTLFERTHDAVFIMDTEGACVEVNEKAAALLGYTLKDFKKLSFGDVVVPSYIPDFEKILEKLLRGETVPTCEKEFRTKDGRVIPAEMSVSGIRDESGNIVYIQSTVRDVTERKRLERALWESEEKYRNLVEQTTDGIAIVQEGVFKCVNLWGAEIIGYTTEELLDTLFTEYVHGALPSVLDHKSMTREGATSCEAALQHKDGHTVYMEVHTGKTTYQGDPATLVIMRDITERKQAHEALLKSEKQYRDFFENAPVGIYRTTPDGRILMANPALVRMLGYTSLEELVQSTLEEAGSKAGYPRSVYKERLEREGQIIGLESTWRRRDGTTLFFRENAKAVRDDSGTILYYEGTIEDITERKKAEEQLRESEEKYRNMVELAPDGIATMDLKGVITSCNTAFLHLTGYSRDEIVGKHFARAPTLRARDIPKYVKMFTSFIRGKIFTSYEFEWVHKDGTIRLGEVHAGAMKEDGRIVGFQVIARDITERKKTEEQLRLSEEKYKSLIENLNVGVYRAAPGRKGRFSDVNQALVRMLGYDTKEEVLALKVSDIYCNPQDRIKVRHKILTEGFLKNEELHLKRKDGTPIIVSDTGKAIYDTEGTLLYFDGILEDITERKRIEDELQKYRLHLEELVRERTAEVTQINEKLSVTLRSIGDGVITTDTDSTVVLINKAAEQLTGYTQEEAVGKPLHTVFHIINERTREPCKNPVEKVLKHGAIVGLSNDTILVSREGAERLIADSGAPIRDRSSKIIGVVLVFRDITEKRKMEKELLRTQKLESLGVLAGGIAHDFNNILTAILGNANLARMYAADNRVVERLTKMEKALLQAKDLTQQLLTFSKGGTPIKKTTSIAELIKDSTSFALRGSNVRCHFYVPDELWLADVDEGQISQAINNLIINADQAMPEGGVIEVKAENVVITAEERLHLPQSRYIEIAIKDQGVGILEEHLQKVFDPFFTTKKKGSGLGLATTYSIIKKHDGHIEVESDVGVGTTFYIWLPASREVCEMKEEKPDEIVGGEGLILLMDDEDIILEAAGEALQYLGYTVEVARDGEEAIHKYKNGLKSGTPFDAVIMDLTVPGGMGGKEAILTLLEIDPEVKAIVSSGYSTSLVMADYQEYGFKGVVTKPYSVEELGKTLHKVLKEKS